MDMHGLLPVNLETGVGAFVELHVGTWNVAGLGEDSIDLFIEQLSDHYTWDVVCLQETFTRTDGIEFSSGHLLFLSRTLKEVCAVQQF